MSDSKPGHFKPLPAADALVQAAERAHWPDIVQQLGAEIAGPLSSALERIQNLIVTGQIDRQSLRALRESVASAREAGIVGQQLSRLVSGQLQLAHERLNLTQMLRSVLTHRARESQVKGIQVRQNLKPAEVITDGSLLFSLLNALMDWALACTHSPIEMRIDFTPWPVRARLSCRFAHRAIDLMDEQQGHHAVNHLNSLSWRLVEQTALTMGLRPLREEDGGITTFTLDFANTVGTESESIDSVEVDQGFEPSTNSKPLAGSHVLIVGAHRDLRMQVQDAIRHMGLIIDQVGTMDEAIAFCQDGLPHGIVFESGAHGASFVALFDELRAEVPDFTFVEVHKDGRSTQLSTASVDGMAHVDANALEDSLPAILQFELAKGL